MKKITKILSFLLVLVFTMSLFTACGDDPVVVEEGEKVTIQWVYGQKLLKEEEVDKGSKITPWTPVEEGKEFQGWYERPYIKKFDFDKVKATKSMRIYASFTSGDDSDGGEYEVPDWYLIGAGKGDLNKANNWNHEAAARYLGLYAGEDGIYRVTLNLYAGDQFKMTKDFGWDAEMAIDKMAGFADGSVKDADGNLVFVAGENNNFVVADGADGKYEITFDPNTALMGFTKLEALETLPDDIRLIGDNNGWGTSYGEDDFKFTTTDNTTWTYTWEVTSLPATFKVYNNSSGVYYPGGVDNDLHIDEVGTYTITFNSKTRNIVVTDANGNNVDVGFTGDSGNSGGGSTVTPNANPVEKVYVVINDAWNDGSKMAAWTWPGDIWADFVPTADPNVYEVTIPVGTNMIIFVDFTGSENNWDQKREQTGDLAIPDKSDDKIYYHVGAAAWSNSTEAPVGGGSGTTGTPSTEALTLFFRNDWLWSDVSCYYWGTSADPEWPGVAMTKVGSSDGYDVYSIELPVGVTGLIFNGVKNDGSGNVDQSPDILTEGLVSGNGFKMIWNGANAVDSFTYDPSACVHNYVGGVCANCGARIAYTVAGSVALCGTDWDTNNTANDMEWDEAAGVYKKVYTGLAAGSYEFKVVQDHSWGVNWGQGGHGGANFVANVAADGATLTIIFDGNTVTFTVE